MTLHLEATKDAVRLIYFSDSSKILKVFWDRYRWIYCVSHYI